MFQSLKFILIIFADVPKLDRALSKIVLMQDSQEKEVAQFMDNTYTLTNNYSNFVRLKVDWLYYFLFNFNKIFCVIARSMISH